MGLFCNPCRQSACKCETVCQCNCNCNCTCECNNETGGETTPEPRQIRVMLDYVLDSCCTTEDVCREITIECPSIFDPCELEVGSIIDVDIPSDIVYKEAKRKKDDCVCLSSVRFTIPIRLYGTSGHGCCCQYIDKEICVIRSAKLCCTTDSELKAFNSKVLAVSAVVSAIECNVITICLCVLFRSCLQQTILREFTWEATPVCISQNCNDTRNSLIDPCDTICGCAEGGGKVCPSC